MKKIVSLILVILIFNLFACSAPSQNASGTSSNNKPLDLSQIKTMGQAVAQNTEENYSTQEGFNETEYIFAFEVGGIYYRAISDLPKDVADALWAADFDEQKKLVPELVYPLPLKTMENLSEKAPSQEELDKLIGKPGKELFDNDWVYYYYSVIDMEAGLNHGVFAYTVKFNYDGPQMENNDDFDFYKEFGDLTIKSVTLSGLGDSMSSIYY